MSDLFQDSVPTEYIAKVGRVMEQANWHTYQILTKRHERLRALLSNDLRWMSELDHVWFGVSVEDRDYGLPRIESLRMTPARVRFLSIEPLLEDLGPLDLSGIHWVILGGESGPGARPMKEAWVASILARCRKQQVPLFFKQWGGVHKKRNGRLLAGREWNGIPAL
jgi:protein gp37